MNNDHLIAQTMAVLAAKYRYVFEKKKRIFTKSKQTLIEMETLLYIVYFLDIQNLSIPK
jgi:hypothetical protein